MRNKFCSILDYTVELEINN